MWGGVACVADGAAAVSVVAAVAAAVAVVGIGPWVLIGMEDKRHLLHRCFQQ